MPEKDQRIAVTLESTMVGPLWARATYSQLYPEILSDPEAADLLEKVRAHHPEAATEFTIMEQFVNEFYGLTFLIRARIFDDAIRTFTATHPKATIVNIGAGLDTTFSRVDNGKLLWYDLDLPEAIEYRKQWLPESLRGHYIAKSVFDYTWFDDVGFIPEKGLFCFAGGLFHYFPETKVAALFHAMAKKFPNGEIFFDMPSSLGIWMLKRRFKQHGIEGIEIHYGMGNPEKQILTWSNRLQVINWFPMFAQIPKNPQWKWKTRVLMRLNDWLKVSKLIHIRFKS